MTQIKVLTVILVRTPHGRETHYATLGFTSTHCGRWLKAAVEKFEVGRTGKATCDHCSQPGSPTTLVDGKFERLPSSQRFWGVA